MLTSSYLEKQKFNYLKPKTKIRECSNPAERKAAAREWLKFACKATRIKRRAKMSRVWRLRRWCCFERNEE